MTAAENERETDVEASTSLNVTQSDDKEFATDDRGKIGKHWDLRKEEDKKDNDNDGEDRDGEGASVSGASSSSISMANQHRDMEDNVDGAVVVNVALGSIPMQTEAPPKENLEEEMSSNSGVNLNLLKVGPSAATAAAEEEDAFSSAEPPERSITCIEEGGREEPSREGLTDGGSCTLTMEDTYMADEDADTDVDVDVTSHDEEYGAKQNVAVSTTQDPAAESTPPSSSSPESNTGLPVTVPSPIDSDLIIRELQQQLQAEQQKSKRLEAERHAALTELEEVNDLRAKIKRLEFEKSKLKAMATAARTAAFISDATTTTTGDLESAVRMLHNASSEAQATRKSLVSQVEALSEQLKVLKQERRQQDEQTVEDYLCSTTIVAALSPSLTPVFVKDEPSSASPESNLTLDDLEDLPPSERVLWLAMTKLRESHERLDEERQQLKQTCDEKSETISLLEEHLELLNAKLAMLESIVKQKEGLPISTTATTTSSSLLKTKRLTIQTTSPSSANESSSPSSKSWKRTGLPFRVLSLGASPTSTTEEIVFADNNARNIHAPVLNDTDNTPKLTTPTSRFRKLLTHIH